MWNLKPQTNQGNGTKTEPDIEEKQTGGCQWEGVREERKS